MARSPHDYRHLTARWRAVARQSGVRLRKLVRVGDDDLFFLKTPALQARGGIYLSAGIHGDEAGASEGLISWAEKNVARLASLPLLIFPVLNPWGLANNRRHDAAGLDLNRLFHRDDHPILQSVKAVVAPFHFTLALMLHEDYDAEGYYLYEVKRGAKSLGGELLRAASPFLPIEPRTRIDGYAAHAGHILRRFVRKRFESIGYPEAIWLHEFHAEHSLTAESPSEFALERRVRAHEAVLDAAVRQAAALLSRRG